MSQPLYEIPGGLRLEGFSKLFPSAIFVTDAAGVIRNVNELATEMFGYNLAEMIGMNANALFLQNLKVHAPIDDENHTGDSELRTIYEETEPIGLRKDGSDFPVDIGCSQLLTLSGAMTLNLVRDTATQSALELHHQRLNSLVESVIDYAIILLDCDGKVLTWNPGAERIKGYTADEIIGSHFASFFTNEDAQRGHPQELMLLAAVRGSVEEEGWRVRKDGSRFWANCVLTAVCNAAGQVTGYANITRDSTDRKRAEEAVMQQLSIALLANLDASKLLEAVSASIAESIQHDFAELTLYEQASGELAVKFLGTRNTDISPGESRIPVNGTIPGIVFSTREPVLLEQIPNSAFTAETISNYTRLGMRSACCVPLVHRGEAIGTLGVASRANGTIGLRQVKILSQIAIAVSMAVGNAAAFRRISELRERVYEEKQYLERELLESRFDDIVGESEGLRKVLQEIETVAPTDATVLIQGETGTGKELLARAIHRLSPRNDRTFIKLNCAAIPAGLLESELFGHEKGAFTGAVARKMGRLELANEGTLFLDEIGELSLDLQPKLLRALQEHQIERLGGTRTITVNVRLIAASNRDLAQMVAAKEFRADLYYRLKVFPVFAPPLRERRDDIPILVRHFVSEHSRRMGKTIKVIPEESMEALVRWPWPGNIRELQNFLERAVILTRGSVLYVPLAELQTDENQGNTSLTEITNLDEAERQLILRAISNAHGQIGGPDGAAARLGLKRTTLNSKLRKYGISRTDFPK
jgi:PAS domain S-box-containing protein